MASLVPYDFYCLGHVTGISLRCAPLQVVVPPGWMDGCASAAQAAPLSYEREAEAARRVDSASSLPLPSGASVEGGGDAFALSRTTTATDDSASTTPPLLSATREGDVGPPLPNVAATDTPVPSAESATPLPWTQSPPPPAAAAVRRPGGAPQLIRLHSPTLQSQMYVELRPAFSASRGNMSEEKAESNGRRATVDTTIAAPASLASLSTPLYVSEVVRGSHHPNWAAIPPATLLPFAHSAAAEVAVYYTADYLAQACAVNATSAAAATAGATDVCVYRCSVDLRQSCYLGSTIEEADAALTRLLRLEEQRAQHQPQCTSPVLYLRCVDGVFVPAACFAGWQAPVAEALREWHAARTRTFSPMPTAADFQGLTPSPSTIGAIAGRNSIAAVSASQTAAACREAEWSRAPSSVGWRYPLSAVPRPGQPRMTMGDVKAATLATLAWQHLAEVAEGRRAVLASELDAAATTHPAERALAARCAALRVQLSAAREALTMSTLEVEGLRERVQQRQRRLVEEEEALAAVYRVARTADSAAAVAAQRESARVEEAQRAALRAQLARSRQQRVRELCLMYTVVLSSQYASQACARAADAKDHINGAALPVWFAGRADADAASHLVASSTDAMHEEAVALGHAGHLLTVLSVLYSCPLPYPILVGSGQSYVLASPNMTAAEAHAAPFTLADARKYALSCRKVAERPMMMMGVELLLRDGAVLAAAMGKSERRIAACADRLGALLDLLLRSSE